MDLHPYPVMFIPTTSGGRGSPTTVAITPTRTALASATPRGTPSTSPELADAKSEG